METAKIMGGADLGGKHKIFVLAMFTSIFLVEISRRQWMYASGVFIFSDLEQMGEDWIKGKRG